MSTQSPLSIATLWSTWWEDLSLFLPPLEKRLEMENHNGSFIDMDSSPMGGTELVQLGSSKTLFQGSSLYNAEEE